MDAFESLEDGEREGPLARYSMELLLREAAERSLANDPESGLKAAARVRSYARRTNDVALEAHAVDEIARARLTMGDDKGVIAATTWLISLFDDPKRPVSLPFYIKARAYGAWADTAIRSSEIGKESALRVTESWERVVTSEGAMEWFPLVLHLRSKVLRALVRLDEARDVAEEALARRRAIPDAPGCPTTCYLRVYASVLGRMGRREDQRKAVENGADLDSASAYSLIALASALYETDVDLPRAEEFARRAVSLEPGEAAYNFSLAAILIREDKWTEGKSILLKSFDM